MINKFPWANIEKYGEADTVILGVPDETRSHSPRKGSSMAPDRIRQVASKIESFERDGLRSTTNPDFFTGNQRIFDYGNISREEVTGLVKKILEDGKFPVIMGGDHSITADVLRGFELAENHLSLIYFDAHPDFICSSKGYYGSVVCDIKNLKNISMKESVEVGLRAIEPEEGENIEKSDLKFFSSSMIYTMGIKELVKELKKIIKGPFYVSFDMDVIDPAFAPGVTLPVPGGISSNDALYILGELSELNVRGFDIMDVCPPFDINDMTSHLAGRLILSALPSK